MEIILHGQIYIIFGKMLNLKTVSLFYQLCFSFLERFTCFW